MEIGVSRRIDRVYKAFKETGKRRLVSVNVKQVVHIDLSKT